MRYLIFLILCLLLTGCANPHWGGVQDLYKQSFLKAILPDKFTAATGINVWDDEDSVIKDNDWKVGLQWDLK